MARPRITEDTVTDDINLNQSVEPETKEGIEEVSLDEIQLEETVEQKQTPKRPPVKPAATSTPVATKPASAPKAEPKAEPKPEQPKAKPAAKAAVAPDPEPEPESEAETTDADSDVQQTYEQEESTGSDNTMLASSECSFTANVEKFLEFLNNVSFSGTMEDAFVQVTPAGLKCNAAEPVSAQITSITNFKEAKVAKEGTLIISKLDKLVKILKLFKDEISLTYKDGYIIITSKDAEIKVLGEAESYVSSYSQLKDIVIDIENKKIGAFDFSKFPYFEMSKSSFDKVWTTISTVNLDSATFKINQMSPNLKIEATDGRDRVDMTIPIENPAITKATAPRFAKCLKALVSTLKGDKVGVWLSDICMVVKQGDNHYVLMAAPATA